MPSGRCLPSAFGMYFRRDGNARYVPALTRAWRSARLASRFSAYWSHVTSSTPGAARFFKLKKAHRRQSVPTWCRSAVSGERLAVTLHLFHLRRDHVTAAEHRASRTQKFQVWAEICSMGWQSILIASPVRSLRLTRLDKLTVPLPPSRQRGGPGQRY